MFSYYKWLLLWFRFSSNVFLDNLGLPDFKTQLVLCWGALKTIFVAFCSSFLLSVPISGWHKSLCFHTNICLFYSHIVLSYFHSLCVFLSLLLTRSRNIELHVIYTHMDSRKMHQRRKWRFCQQFSKNVKTTFFLTLINHDIKKLHSASVERS